MNPGILDRKIHILRNNPKEGRFGESEEDWNIWKTRRAKRIESRGAERTESGRKRTAGVVVFKTYYIKEISSADRLLDARDCQEYEIEDFSGDPRQNWMEIICTRYRTPENKR